MSSTPLTLRGTISPIDHGSCRVALLDNEDREWAISPRGAGADLADMVGAPVEVLCTIVEEGEINFIHVRSYKELDDNIF